MTVGVVTSVVLIAFVTLVSIKTRHEAIESAEKIALSESQECAEHILVEMNEAIIANRTLCDVVGSAKDDNASKLDRNGINSILKKTLETYPDFLGAYTTWESNEFDGNDVAFVGTPGHDSTGRFLPY